MLISCPSSTVLGWSDGAVYSVEGLCLCLSFTNGTPTPSTDISTLIVVIVIMFYSLTLRDIGGHALEPFSFSSLVG